MRHLNLIRHLGSDKAINALTWAGLIGFALYFYFMVVSPFVSSGFNLSFVVSVWDRWQALNVGILAFSASIIALNATRYRTAKDRENKFAAARAFLPAILSELTDYLSKSSSVYEEAWKNASDEAILKSTKINSVPNLPEELKDIFTRCIEFSEPNVSEYLAVILEKLQIHHARLRDLPIHLSPKSDMVVVKENFRSNLYGAAEIQVLINNLFSYARGESELNPKTIEYQDYRNAFASMGLNEDKFDGLKEHVQRKLGIDGNQR